MKKGWQTKKLGEVCDFQGGSQPPKSQFIYKEKTGYVRFLQIRDFGSDKNITYIPQAKKNQMCNENDILIGRYGASVGKILTNKAGAYNVALMKTLPNLEELNRSWFYNYLLSDEFQVRLLNVGGRAAQAGFSKDDIYNFPVPLPPLPEQQRIVGILDEAFAGLATAKANAEKNLQNARALFESRLQSVFSQRGEGWVEDQLDALTVADSPITYGVVKPGNEGEVRFVRGGDLVRGKVRLTQLRTITKAVSDQYRRTLLKGGELLICLVGQPGQVGVAPLELAGANIARQVGLIRLKSIVDAEFVRYFLQSAPGAEALGARESGSVQQVINLGELRQVQVPYPSLDQQREIITRLETMEAETQRLAAIYQSKLAALEALKKSLLHQAFSGEL